MKPTRDRARLEAQVTFARSRFDRACVRARYSGALYFRDRRAKARAKWVQLRSELGKLKLETGVVCKVCHQDRVAGYCSRFCALATEEEVATFLAAKEGQHCRFPCRECGEILEGEYYVLAKYGAMCSPCYSKTRLRDRTELLWKVRDVLRGLRSLKELVDEIDEVLSDSTD